MMSHHTSSNRKPKAMVHYAFGLPLNEPGMGSRTFLVAAEQLSMVLQIERCRRRRLLRSRVGRVEKPLMSHKFSLLKSRATLIHSLKQSGFMSLDCSGRSGVRRKLRGPRK